MDGESIHFDIQNLSSCRKFIVEVVDCPMMWLLKVGEDIERVKSLEINYASNTVINQEVDLVISLEPFRGIVKVYEEDRSDDLFVIYVSKSHRDSPPEVKLDLSKSGPKKCALYCQLNGGGNTFVIALGDKEEQVSEEAVKRTQILGAVRTFAKIPPLGEDIHREL
jgi:hypothetical protein